MKLKINTEKLAKALPHGSGIDSDWIYKEHKNGKVTFYNSFHALNSNGYYTGYMPFKFTVRIAKLGSSDILTFRRIICCENRADFKGLRNYIEELILNFLVEINDLNCNDYIIKE